MYWSYGWVEHFVRGCLIAFERHRNMICKLSSFLQLWTGKLHIVQENGDSSSLSRLTSVKLTYSRDKLLQVKTI